VTDDANALVGAGYRSFAPLTSWRACRADSTVWAATLRRLSAAQASADAAVVDDEVARSLRAAALNTGAIEGLHNADRGLTITVVAEAAWREAIEHAEGPRAAEFVDAALAAFDLSFDIATGQQPVSEAIIRELHRTVTGPQPTYEAQTPLGRRPVTLPRGEYKHLPNHVLEPDGSVHAYAPPDVVPAEMHRLVEELSGDDIAAVHPPVLAAYAHHALVAIHPFADGNGRVARLLGSAYLLRAASVPLMVWNDQAVEYRAALKAADRGEPQRFIDFVTDRAVDAMNLMTDRLRARAATARVGQQREQALQEDRQLAAAGRLVDLLDRSLDAVTVRISTPWTAVVTRESAISTADRSFPFGDARILRVGRHDTVRARHFVVTVPRDERDALWLDTDEHDGRRAVRVADLEPELRAALVAQIEAFVERHAMEMQAALPG
jgi:Fic family protein